MAFSSSHLAIEQVTFEADDQRCNQQNVSSLQDLVNFDCEFPQQESMSFYKLFKKRETFHSGLNEYSENIKNFDESILKSETSRSNTDESFNDHVSIKISKNLIQPMFKKSNNDSNLNEDKVFNFHKMNSSNKIITNESVQNDPSKNIDQASIDIEKVLKHAEEILRNAQIDELTSHSPQLSNSSKAHPTKESNTQSKNKKKQISWISRTNSQSSLVTNDEHSDKIGYAYSNTNYLNSEISRLREENELLIIKINKLKYEIRSKDQVADDLKQKIAQMHIELESTSLSKTQFLTDIESLRNDLNRLNGEKSGLYQNLKDLLYENDQLQEKLKLEYKKSNEQASLIDRLQKENDELSKESIDVKMRCLKEKEDLVRNLEQIETDIIRREQNMFTQKYEKILIESCEAIKINEAKKYNDMLKKEVENIRKDYETKLDEFKKTSENTKTLIHEYSNKEKSEKNLVLNLEKFENEKQNLKSKINQYEVEIEHLKKSLQSELDKSDAKSIEIISINKQKFKLMAQIKQIVKEKEENENLKNEILILKNKLNIYENQKNEIKEQKEKEIITQINQSKDYDDKIIELKQKNEKLENELNILDTLKLQSECDIITLRNEMDSKDEEIANLNDEIQKIRSVLQMTESNQDIEDKKLRLGEKIKQFEQDILNQQEISEKLNLNLVQWNNANQILEQEILNNQQLNQKLNEQLASDQKDISSLQQCYENLKFDQNEASKKIDELETKRLELKLKIESLEAEISEFQELNTQLVDNLQQWQQANKILEEQIIEAQQQSSNYLNQSKELVEKIKLEEEKSLIQEFTNKSECVSHQDEELNLMHTENKIESLIDQNTQTVHDTSDDLENSMIATKYKLEGTEIKLIEDEIIRNQELYSNLRENLVEWENANRILEKQIIDLQTQNNELALSHQSFEPKLLFDDSILKLKQEYEEQLNSNEKRIEDLLFKLSKFEENSVSNATNDLKGNSNLIDQVSTKENFDYTLNSEKTDEIDVSIKDSVTLIKNEDDKIRSPIDEKQNILNEEQKKLFDQLESKNRLIEELNKTIDQYSNLSKMSKSIEDLETCKYNLKIKTNDLENEINTIQKTILENEELHEQLKINLTEWNNANETLEAKILEYQSENMGLTLKLDDQIAKNNEDNVKIISDRYTKEIEELKIEIDRQQQINEEIDSLKEVIELKDQKLNDLNAMLEQFKNNDNHVDNINALEQKKSELDSQVLNIEQEISNLEASILEKQNLSSQLSQNLIEWQNSNQVLEDQIISLQQQNSQLLNEQSLETINQQNLDKINSLQKINQELLESNAKYKEEIQNSNNLEISKADKELLENRIIDLEREIQFFRNERDNCLLRISRLDEELKALRIQNNYLISETEKNYIQANISSEINVINDKIPDSTNYNSQLIETKSEEEFFLLELKYKDLFSQNEILKSEKNELYHKVNQFENDLNLLSNQIEQDFDLNSSSSNDINELMDQVTNLKDDNFRLHKENESQILANDDLSKKLDLLNAQLILKDQQKNGLEMNEVILMKEIDELKISLDKMSSKFNDKKIEFEALQKEINDERDCVNEERKDLITKNELLQKEIEQQAKDLIKFKKIIKKLKKDYNDCIEAKKDLEEEKFQRKEEQLDKEQFIKENNNHKDPDEKKIEITNLKSSEIEKDLSILNGTNSEDKNFNSESNKNKNAKIIKENVLKTSELFKVKNNEKDEVKDYTQIQHLRNQFNLKNEEIDSLKEVIELKDQKFNDLNAMLEQFKTNDNLVDNINAIEQKKSELDSQVLKIEQEISNLEASILEKQNLSSQLSQNLIEWQNSNQVLEDQIISLQQQNSQLLNEQSLETINQQNLDKINRLQKINQELLESNEKYKEEITLWEVREQEMFRKIDELEKARQELQIQNMDLLCDVDSLRSEKEVLENEQKDLSVNDSSKSELTNTVTNKVKDLEAIIDDLKKEMSEKDEQFQISIKSLESEIEHRQNEYNLLISNFESLQSSDQKLQNKNKDLLGQIDALKLQNQSLQTDLTSFKEIENRCNNFIENVQDLNSQIVLKDQELNDLKNQNNYLLSELDLVKVKKEEIEFLYNKSVSGQCELHDLNTEIDSLKSQLESKSLDITEFKNKINFASQEHEKMIKFFDNKISDLNAKIDSKDDLINILQSEIKTLKPNEEFNKTASITLGKNIISIDPDIQIDILNNIVQSQKLLIDKLEKESKKMCFLYEKLIFAQRRLISKQDQCYNDAIHSLINSFQDLDPNQIDHKVQEIESDLNNLIHVLNSTKDVDWENASSITLDLPHSLQNLRQFISQHSSPVKVSDSVNSLTEKSEINSHQDATVQEDNLKHKSATSLLLMVKKCDAETQCEVNYYKDDHTGTLRLSTDFNEINNLQDLIANYLNLIKSYKSLLAKLDAVSVDNSELREANSFLNDEFLKLKKSNSKNQISLEIDGHRTGDLYQNEKIHNLKSAYENLYSLYQHHKSESIKSYNKLHNAYIQLINPSKNNL